jgi:hypothetical protein
MSCEIIKRIKEEIERDRDYKLLTNEMVKVKGKIDTKQKPGRIAKLSDFGFKCAFTEKPECDQPGGCSKPVLVIRDCGDGTLKSYSISRYRPDGWGNTAEYLWLDQESNGYRVLKWAYLPDLSS